MRTFLAYFHLLNFLIMIFVTVYLLNSSWGQTEDWLLAIYSYYVIVGVSGVVIALWIAIDGKRLERYALKIRELEKKLVAVEQKIRNIKPPHTQKKSEPQSRLFRISTGTSCLSARLSRGEALFLLRI